MLQFAVRVMIACGAPTGMMVTSPAFSRIGGNARNWARPGSLRSSIFSDPPVR